MPSDLKRREAAARNTETLTAILRLEATNAARSHPCAGCATPGTWGGELCPECQRKQRGKAERFGLLEIGRRAVEVETSRRRFREAGGRRDLDELDRVERELRTAKRRLRYAISRRIE